MTENAIGFKLPDGSDFYNLKDFKDNFEKITQWISRFNNNDSVLKNIAEILSKGIYLIDGKTGDTYTLTVYDGKLMLNQNGENILEKAITKIETENLPETGNNVGYVKVKENNKVSAYGTYKYASYTVKEEEE